MHSLMCYSLNSVTWKFIRKNMESFVLQEIQIYISTFGWCVPIQMRSIHHLQVCIWIYTRLRISLPFGQFPLCIFVNNEYWIHVSEFPRDCHTIEECNEKSERNSHDQSILPSTLHTFVWFESEDSSYYRIRWFTYNIQISIYFACIQFKSGLLSFVGVDIVPTQSVLRM